MNNKITNQPTSAPSLMGHSAKYINADTARSGMISRLEDPTGKNKSKKLKHLFGIPLAKIFQIVLLGILTAILSTIILYLTLRTNASEDAEQAPVVTYSNELHPKTAVDETINEAAQTITANETVVSDATEGTPAATIVTEPDATLISKVAEPAPAIENPHEQLSKALMGNDTPVIPTSKGRSAEESVVSHKPTSTLAKTKAEPNHKNQALGKAEASSSKPKSTVKNAKTNKQDTDIKVIDALVAQKSENPQDRDIKVLAALVAANNPQADAQPFDESAKPTTKTLVTNGAHPAKSNAAPANQSKQQPRAAQPMTLGNAGETIADELAKCGELNFIEAPICRVKTCFGHVGSIPECTPELKKPEVNTDSSAVFNGR